MNIIYKTFDEIIDDLQISLPNNFKLLAEDEKATYKEKIIDIMMKYIIDFNSEVTLIDVDFIPNYLNLDHSFLNFIKYIYITVYFDRIYNEMINAIDSNNLSTIESVINVLNELQFEDSGRFEKLYYDNIFEKILEKNINLVKYYNGDNPKLLKILFSKGVKVGNGYLNRIINSSKYNKSIENAFVYFGIIAINYDKCELKEISDFVLQKDHPTNLTIINILNDLYFNSNVDVKNIYDQIFIQLISNNINYIKYYQGINVNILKIIVDNGLYLSDEQIGKIIEGFKNSDISEEDAIKYFEILKIKPFDYHALREYKWDSLKLIKSFSKLDSFIEKLDINRDNFIQFGFGIDYDWLDTILSIFDNNMDIFIKIKNLFFEKYYYIDKKDSIIEIKNIMDLLKIFSMYPELCCNLTDEKLNEQDISKLKILFNAPNFIDNIKTINDLNNIDNIIFNNYIEEFKSLRYSDNIEELKNIICKLLFNKNLKEVKIKLRAYGGVKELRQ